MSELIRPSYKERSELEQLLKSSTPARIARRAQALLLLEEAESVADVAQLLRVSRQTIYNWAARFERLADGTRSGRPVVGSLIH